jgi:peroxiredoxin
MAHVWSRCAALALAVALGTGCVPPDPEPTKIGDLLCEPAPDHPAGPYGTLACDGIADLCFVPANDGAVAAAGEDGGLSLSDLFADASVVGVLLFGTAGWCQFCTQEAAWLNEIYPALQDIDGRGGRVEVLAVVFEDDFGGAVDQSYAEAYAAYKGLAFPAVADPFKAILDYFDAAGAPGNVFISRDGATIEQVLQGFDQGALERALGGLDGTTGCR